MNYIELINNFWLLRRSKRITSKETDLYFFLVQECNTRSWENPFQCANKLIIASIDMKEPTLIEARNKLKQLGLIDFIGGEKNVSAPIYTIQLGSNLYNLSRNHSRSRVESIVETEEKAEHTIKLNKTKLNKTNVTETKVSPNVKNENDFLKKITECWYKFFLEKNHFKPTINAIAISKLKSLNKKIRQKIKEYQGENADESDEFVLEQFTKFLDLAWEDKWLKENFLLKNLESQFDSILIKHKTKNDKQTSNRSSFEQANQRWT